MRQEMKHTRPNLPVGITIATIIWQAFPLFFLDEVAAGAGVGAGRGFSNEHIASEFMLENRRSSNEMRNSSLDFAKHFAQNERNVQEEGIPKQTVQQFELWKPSKIPSVLTQWADQYPDLVRVTTSQEAYGLPRAGGPSDCPFDEGDGCKNYILTLQDFVAHPVGSESSKFLPEVLWSGEVHGNEQVGPTAVLEAAQLLLKAAACESLPRVSYGNLSRAKTCREELRNFGISDENRQWLARLVSTRRIVIVPTANALGYFRKVREEGRIDPNRDFPFDLRNPSKCMVTIAARTLNEVFREHMFQLSLTFHGGMEIIAYEWGAPTYDQVDSPDDTAQKQIAAAYSRYAGGWKETEPYQTGAMNPMVYPVRGGMEDWAYAASWDPKRVIQCQPTSFGGYPAEKTVYDESNLRVFNMLVETSNNKIPPKSQLGSTLDIMTRSSKGNGHVARNIRLALLAAELVQPYVSIKKVNELTLSDDVVPLVDHSSDSCRKDKAVRVPHNSRKVVMGWTVGGSLEVNTTQLWYAKWSDIPKNFNCWMQPTEKLESFMKMGTPIGPSYGSTRFSTVSTPSPLFTASFEIDNFKPNDEILVIATAKVDTSWATQGERPIGPAGMPPQSHIVNARTNPTWHHEHAGKVIQGRLFWASIPVTIVIGEQEKSVGKDGSDDLVRTIELSNRFDEHSGNKDGFAPTTVEPWSWLKGLFILVAAVSVLVVGRSWLNRRMRLVRREHIIRDYIEEDDDHRSSSSDLRQRYSNGYEDARNDSGDDLALEVNGQVEMGSYSDKQEIV